jgi:hypothetical protein
VLSLRAVLMRAKATLEPPAICNAISHMTPALRHAPTTAAWLPALAAFMTVTGRPSRASLPAHHNGGMIKARECAGRLRAAPK